MTQDETTIPHYVSASDCIMEVVKGMHERGLTIDNISQNLNNNIRRMPTSVFDPTVITVLGTIYSTATISYVGEGLFNPSELCESITFGGVGMIVNRFEATANVSACPERNRRPETEPDRGSFTVQFVASGE